MNIEKIASLFSERFAHWDITIPVENLQTASPGHIAKGGWLIQFCFGRDADGAYLDYYATHRMTDDCHIRLHENGTYTELESLQGFFVTSEDPVEAARLEEGLLKSNRKIMNDLAEKGFTLFTINMALRTGPVDSEEE